MKLILCILLIALAVAKDDCYPLYWQVNTTFKLANDEVLQYTKVPLNPSDVTKSQLQSEIKCTYSINHVATKQTYDGSAVNISGNGTEVITVSNNVVNLALSYLANKTTTSSLVVKAYNGTGAAVLNRMVVNFTKKLVSKAGISAFELVKYNFDLPNSMTPSKFVPDPANEKSNNTLWNLVIDDLYVELKKTVNASLNLTLTNVIANESFPNTFGGETYVYPYRDASVTFSSHMESLNFLPEGGIVIGYDMSIVSWTSNCSKFQPSDLSRSASYITFEMIQGMVDYVSKNSKGWTNMRLDGSNTKSSVFQFYMADLEDILPKAVETYPALLSKTYANCSIDPASIVLSIDSTYKLIKVAAKWSCTLYLDGANIKLLDLSPQISYEIKLLQEGRELKTVIASAFITGSSWSPLDDFPLENEKLANFYLKSLSSTFVGQTTLGSGFYQPARKVPTFEFNDKYIRIIDGAGDQNQSQNLRVQ